MNSSENAVNRLTGSHTDQATHTPAYKETAAARTPEAIRTLRNLILLRQKLDSIDPELLGHLIDSVPEGLARATERREPPGLFSLAQKFSSKESRRGLMAAAEILETFGRRLSSLSSEGEPVH